MSPGARYVFISYSRADGEYVELLTKHLEDAGLRVWTDNGIDYGSQWPIVIATQIDGCAAFVPVMSPRSRESDWVLREILYAQENRKPILPTLLDGKRFIELIDVQDEAVVGGRLPSSRFIERLRALTSVDGPRDAEGDPAGDPVSHEQAAGRVRQVEPAEQTPTTEATPPTEESPQELVPQSDGSPRLAPFPGPRPPVLDLPRQAELRPETAVRGKLAAEAILRRYGSARVPSEVPADPVPRSDERKQTPAERTAVARLFSLWPLIIGAEFEKGSQPVKLEGGTLTVIEENPYRWWTGDLRTHLESPEVMKRIRKEAGLTVTSIAYRAAGFDPRETGGPPAGDPVSRGRSRPVQREAPPQADPVLLVAAQSSRAAAKRDAETLDYLAATWPTFGDSNVASRPLTLEDGCLTLVVETRAAAQRIHVDEVMRRVNNRLGTETVRSVRVVANGEAFRQLRKKR